MFWLYIQSFFYSIDNLGFSTNNEFNAPKQGEDIVKKHFLLLDNLNIKYKLILIYILFGILPFLVLALFSVQKSYSSILSEHQQVLEVENRQVKNVLFGVVSFITNASRQLQEDQALCTLLTTRYENSEDIYRAYRSYQSLDTLKQSFSEIADIHIYYQNPTMVSSGFFQKAIPEIRGKQWYQEAVNSSGDVVWFYDETLCENGKLHLAKAVHLTPDETAVVVFTVSDYYLNYINDDSNLISLFVLNEETIFFSYPDAQSDLFSTLLSSDNFTYDQNIIQNLGDSKLLVYATQFQSIYGDDSFQIISINPYAASRAASSSTEFIFWMLLSISVPFLAMMLFVNRFSKRIAVLKAQMENITSENYNILSWSESKDELGILFRQMLKTISSIQHLNEEIYQKQLEAQNLKLLHNQMKYEMLASQINPHFLFNSLESIHMKAEANEDYEVSYISELLGEILQYSLHVKNRQTSLQEELSYAEKYLKFQRIRFDDRLSYRINVGTMQTEQYAILPMLIQPLIENSIQHGFEHTSGSIRIEIRVDQTEEFTTICVHDDGIGMDSETLRSLLTRLRSGNTQTQNDETSDRERTHIGLSNIYQRIKLFYGENYTLSIDSSPGQGTTATLFLPSNSTIGPQK